MLHFLTFQQKVFAYQNFCPFDLLYSLHLFIFLKSPTVDLTVTEQLSPFFSYLLVGDQVQNISFRNSLTKILCGKTTTNIRL